MSAFSCCLSLLLFSITTSCYDKPWSMFVKKPFYYQNKCFVQEGLRIELSGKCELFPNGKLMSEKSQTQINDIIDGLTDNTKHTPGLNIVLSEKLNAGDVLKFKGRVIDTNSNCISYAVLLNGFSNFYGLRQTTLQTNFIQSKKSQKIRFSRRHHYTKVNVDALNHNKSVDNINQQPELTIIYMKDNQFEIRVDKDVGYIYSYPIDEQHYYINNIQFFSTNVQLYSATINGKQMRTDDNDTSFGDCLAVGLHAITFGFSSRTWMWESENVELADDSALWDTDAGQPDNKNGDENYACVNIHTKKLRDISGLLKRYVICEYDDHCITDTELLATPEDQSESASDVTESCPIEEDLLTTTSESPDSEVTSSTHTEDLLAITSESPDSEVTGSTRTEDLLAITSESSESTPDITTEAVATIGEMAAKVTQSLGWSSILISCSGITAIFLFLRDFSHERCLHMSQELCMLLSHSILFAFWENSNHKISCVAASLGTQMFTVALFMFMIFESLHSYSVMTNVVRRGAWHTRFTYQLISWGTAIVCISVNVLVAWIRDFESLTDGKSCWLNYGEKPVYLFTVGPVVVAFGIVAVFTEASGIDMRKPIFGYSISQRHAAYSNRFAMMSLLPLQMASFVFNSLAIYLIKNYNSYALCHVTSIINIILASLIFFFHCMGNPKAHALLMRLWSKYCCKKKAKIAPPPKIDYFDDSFTETIILT